MQLNTAKLCLVWMATLVVIAGGAGAQPAEQVPVPQLTNPLVALMPELKQAPAPAWVKEKLRVTYYGACASVPRERYYYYIDRQGLLQRGDEVGPGGQGYLHCDVVAMDNQKAVCSLSMYGIDPLSGQIIPMPPSVDEGLPGAGAVWANPRVLERAERFRGNGLKVVKMDYPLGGKSWRAIRFDYKGDDTHTAAVFDLDTGLLIHYNHAVDSADGTHVQMATMEYKGQRQLAVPWSAAALPDWLEQGMKYRMTGGLTVMIPGSPTFPMPTAQDATVLKVGRKWATVQVTQSLNGMPNGTQTVVTGVSQLFWGAWISPEGLRRLQPGQVIDEDPFTKSTVTVTHCDADCVALTEAGPSYSTTLIYSTENGGLAASRDQRQVGAAVHQVELEAAM